MHPGKGKSGGSMTMDKERADFSLARLKKSGENWEVVIEPNTAIALRNGEAVEIRDALRSEDIFSDAKKGMQAPEHNFQSVFKTNNQLEIAKMIIMEGDLI